MAEVIFLPRFMGHYTFRLEASFCLDLGLVQWFSTCGSRPPWVAYIRYLYYVQTSLSKVRVCEGC